MAAMSGREEFFDYERNEDDLQKAISVNDQKIDEFKWKIILRYREIKAPAGTGSDSDDPRHSPGTDPEEDPMPDYSLLGPGTDPEEDPIIKKLRRRIQELEEEVNNLKEDLKSYKKEAEKETNNLKRRVECLEDDRRVVLIGEMCRRLQENIYRYVLPAKVFINNKHSYKVAKLSKFIKKNKIMSDDEKKDAEKRAKDIKTDLNWDDWEDLIKDLQEQRDVKSHKPITGEVKKEVMDAIEDLNKERFFESMNSSSEEVKKILEMFNKTEQMLK